MIVAIPVGMAVVLAISFIGPRDATSPTPNPATGQTVLVHNGETGTAYYETSFQLYRGMIAQAAFVIVPIVIVLAFRRGRSEN